MRRGKSRMGSRKNLLKSTARDAAKSTKSRALKQKLAYPKQAYDGHESEED